MENTDHPENHPVIIDNPEPHFSLILLLLSALVIRGYKLGSEKKELLGKKRRIRTIVQDSSSV